MAALPAKEIFGCVFTGGIGIREESHKGGPALIFALFLSPVFIYTRLQFGRAVLPKFFIGYPDSPEEGPLFESGALCFPGDSAAFHASETFSTTNFETLSSLPSGRSSSDA